MSAARSLAHTAAQRMNAPQHGMNKKSALWLFVCSVCEFILRAADILLEERESEAPSEPVML
jgi:hypothetical protein